MATWNAAIPNCDLAYAQYQPYIDPSIAENRTAWSIRLLSAASTEKTSIARTIDLLSGVGGYGQYDTYVDSLRVEWETQNANCQSLENTWYQTWKSANLAGQQYSYTRSQSELDTVQNAARDYINPKISTYRPLCDAENARVQRIDDTW